MNGLAREIAVSAVVLLGSMLPGLAAAQNELNSPLLPKLKVAVVVKDSALEQTIETITSAAIPASLAMARSSSST